ncbi:MAG: TRAP transporter substrate-binding protein [Deltaproteobacteria bacterium]|nr:TRAP transporter substrate-binding protein [Deltaproteobacteria bacterium]MBW2153710.1 TRAP transporter substrate-binding protein [Deltaproteobacteria bacterium]
MKKPCVVKIFTFVMLACMFMVATAVSHVAAKPVTLKMATKMPFKSPEGQAFLYFAELVKKKTNGTLIVNVYPSEQLGTTEVSLKGVQMGAIDIYAEGMSYLKMFIPEYEYFTPPFVYRDREQFLRFMRSEYMQGLERELAEKHGIKLIDTQHTWMRGPYRVLCATRPIMRLEDLQGIKMRMFPNQFIVQVWTELGARPTVLPWTETYLALKQGIVEMVTSPISLVHSMKFTEPAKYVTRTDEYPQTIVFPTNAKKFNKLSPEHQKALIDACNEAGLKSNELIGDAAEKVIRNFIEKDNAVFIRTNMEPFRKKLEPFYERAEKEGKIPAGILDRIRSFE